MNANEKAVFAKGVASDVFGHNALRLLAEGLPCKPGTHGHSIAFASDGRITVGKRDRTGEVDGIAMVRAADAHAQWFGDKAVRLEAAPKRRAMTDAQRACLRGDV